ncbi:MAG: hemin-degrading factor [Labilithrix sp.]|nr:hemin-degrading factor [Labilithrix sp.]
MKRDPAKLRDEWSALRASTPGLKGLETAERLGVSEVEIAALGCGGGAAGVSATRLEADWPAFIGELPKLGKVKAVTRNASAVIEVEGTYDNIAFFGPMGQSVSTIDLRIFSSRWKHGFAFREETKRGLSRGLSFFDGAGRAIHKLFARPESDAAFFDELVRRHTARDQSPAQEVSPPDPPPPERPDADIDAVGLREAWLAMQDTHELHGLLRRHGATREQAFRLLGGDLAYAVAPGAFEQLLRAAAGTGLEIMIFVGNPGLIQIYSGPIVRVAPMGPWINVLDPGFDLHVRTDRIARAWIVLKPTSDGHVTSLEVYDARGEQIALMVGKRKPGQEEQAAWRKLAEGV